MSRRRANITITAKNPDDAFRLLEQLGEAIKDRNVRVNLKSDKPSDAEPDKFRCTSRDEQLETDARAAIGRGIEEAATPTDTDADARPPLNDRVEEIVAARRKLIGRMASIAGRGILAVVRTVAEGVANSTLNK